jgi:TRAP-type C4-dicarboxylate transport system permease small subunit
VATPADPTAGRPLRLPPFLRPVDAVLAASASTATAAVVVLVTIEVIARYAFSSSIFFANELARLLFVWAIFLGFPLALSRGRHVGIELLDSVLGRFGARVAIRLGAALGAFLLAFVGWKSVEVMLFNWDQTMNTMPVSAGLFYVPVVIGMVVGVAYLLAVCVVGERTLVPDDGGDPLD